MQTLLIKRYKNRKLYTGGKYISLVDVLKLLQSKQPFKAIDHDGRDITKQLSLKAMLLLENN